jgi:hypothetical protein
MERFDGRGNPDGLKGEKTLEIIKRGQVKKFDPKRSQKEGLLWKRERGMIPANGLYTENGTLLIPDGEESTENYITKILNHHRIHPLSQTLFGDC